ncbi:MAG: 50S ribosomal protein L9 [Minisyncoccota bacterium]
MRVLFLQDVATVGKKNDVKDITDGYARNFLFPRKLAVAATPDIVLRMTTKHSSTQALKTVRDTLVDRNLADLAEKRIEISVLANEQGNLFAGIGAREIATAVKNSAGIELLAHDIILPHSIKTTGTFDVPVRIGKKEGIVHIVIVSKS